MNSAFVRLLIVCLCVLSRAEWKRVARVMKGFYDASGEKYVQFECCDSESSDSVRFSFDSQPIVEPRWDMLVRDQALILYVHESTLGKYHCEKHIAIRKEIIHCEFHVLLEEYSPQENQLSCDSSFAQGKNFKPFHIEAHVDGIDKKQARITFEHCLGNHSNIAKAVRIELTKYGTNKVSIYNPDGRSFCTPQLDLHSHYKVVVTTEDGRKSRPVFFRTGHPPTSIPNGIVVKSISDTSVVFHFDNPDSLLNTIDGYMVLVKRNKRSFQDDNVEKTVNVPADTWHRTSNNRLVHQIDGLVPNRQYHLNIRYYNKDGNGELSNVVEVKTLKAQKKHDVDTIELLMLTDDAIKVGWKSKKPALRFSVTLEGPDYHQTVFTKENEMTFTNLEPSTMYKVSVRRGDIKRDIPYTMRFQTLDGSVIKLRKMLLSLENKIKRANDEMVKIEMENAEDQTKLVQREEELWNRTEAMNRTVAYINELESELASEIVHFYKTFNSRSNVRMFYIIVELFTIIVLLAELTLTSVSQMDSSKYSIKSR